MLDFIGKPINPTTPRLFTVVSLFAGCGGSSLGYKWAGGKVLAAVEFNANAAETYRLNHHGTSVLERDIATVTAQEMLEVSGLPVGALDILDGSPPCQGFSTAGKRVFADSRNDLFREYVRLLRGLRPRVFIMENVSGLVKGVMKHKFAEMMRELKASGYRVRCQLLNAMYFGVPQSRERLIFIGVRDDLGAEPSHPEARTTPVTVRQALEGVAADPTAFTVGAHTKIYQDMRRVPAGGSQPGHHSHIRLHDEKPAQALLADSGFGHYHYWHPREHRTLTFLELQRCASFPDAWQLTGEPGQRWARIGNSVPPRFMESIAEHVHAHILSKTERVAAAVLTDAGAS